MFTTSGMFFLLLVLGRTQDFVNKETNDFSRLLQTRIRRNLGMCQDKLIDLEVFGGSSHAFNNRYSGHEYTPSCRTSSANEQIFRHVVRPGEKFRIRQSHNSFDSIHELAVGTSCENRQVIDCRDYPDDAWMEYTNWSTQNTYAFFIVDAYWNSGNGDFTLVWETSRPSICEKVIDLRAQGGNTLTATTTNKGNQYEPTCRRAGLNEQMFKHLVRPGETFRIYQSHNNYDSVHELSVGNDCQNREVVECTDDPDDKTMYYTNNSSRDKYAFFMVDAYSGSGQFTLDWGIAGRHQGNYRRYNQVDRPGGDIRCGFESVEALKGACTADPRCVGYTIWEGRPWCLKTSSSESTRFKHNVDFYQKS